MIFKNKFDDLTKEQIELLNGYFDGYDYQSSAHTLLAHYMWRNTHNISWMEIGQYLCIASLATLETEEPQHYMSFPLTKTGDYDVLSLKETLEEAKEIFQQQGQELYLSLVPGELLPYLQQCYPDGLENLQHDRDDDDYIYLKEDLISLSGRRLHQKKNHLNYFLSHYEYTYEEATPEIVPEIVQYIRQKNKYKLGETPEEWKEILELETKAIEELLQFVGKGLLSGIIRMDGEIVAVTLGEFSRTNNKETVLVHVEKADDRIRGLYQVINNEFCKHLPEETKYVNREEDMGLMNLRQTKLSYKPLKLAEKYSAIVK